MDDTSEQHAMEAHRRRLLIAGAAGFMDEKFDAAAMPSVEQAQPDSEAETRKASDAPS